MAFFARANHAKGEALFAAGTWSLTQSSVFWLGPAWAPPSSWTLVLLPRNQTTLKALACLEARRDLFMFIFSLQSTGSITSHLSSTGIACWVLPCYSNNSKFAYLALSNNWISFSQVFLLPQIWFPSCVCLALTQKWPLYDINAVPFAGRISCFISNS